MGVPDQMASISDPGDAYQIAGDSGSVTPGGQKRASHCSKGEIKRHQGQNTDGPGLKATVNLLSTDKG